MEKTENYSFNMPSSNDFYNIEDFNENAEIADKELKRIDNELGNKAESTHDHNASEVSTKYHPLEEVGSGYEPPVGGKYTVEGELSRFAEKIVELASVISGLTNGNEVEY